jgi:tRNA modification GTPase
MKTDTIAAIATALSDSGIGIIRVSGDEAVEIIDRIYRNKRNEKTLAKYDSHTIHYGYITEEEGAVIDEVMVSVMKSPRSYTTEDTVEINCHGGILMMRKILETVIKAGARIAEPGEFTKRAFLNGRIDLSRAEAVMDIIHAKNDFALQSSVKQLKGSVSDKVRNLRDDILYEIAFIESALDDPEHISLDGYHERLSEKTDMLMTELDKLLVSADDGRMLKEGIHTVIVGKPNAGKSSLLNLIVGEDKAIVTDIAGTTRDTLEEVVSLGGISLNIIDTAGIRNTEDVVEKIGVERAKKISVDADLILYVVDSSMPLDENDRDIIQLIQDKNTIILLNKSDLDEIVREEDVIHEINRIRNDKTENALRVVRTSTKFDSGIEELIHLIKEMFFHGKISYNDEVYITNMRHKEAIQDAKDSILQVRKSLDMDMPEDFYSIDLMSAYASLGKIIGEEVGDDLVNEIFSNFCMGK